MIIIIGNYLLFFLKLIIFCLVTAVPITFLVFILEKKFKIINKKKSFFTSLFILIFIVSYILLIIIYFLPLIIAGFNEPTIWLLIQVIVFNLIRLLLVNILFSAMLLVLGFITSAIYELLENKFIKSKNKNKKDTNKLNLVILWFSISKAVGISFIIFLIFPKLLALIIYLIYF